MQRCVCSGPVGRCLRLNAWIFYELVKSKFCCGLNANRSYFDRLFGVTSPATQIVSRAAFRNLLKVGQNSCFRIPGGASATCCIYIVKFQGGANIQQGGANAPPP